jgi:hypothetical protein
MRHQIDDCRSADQRAGEIAVDQALERSSRVPQTYNEYKYNIVTMLCERRSHTAVDRP